MSKDVQDLALRSLQCCALCILDRQILARALELFVVDRNTLLRGRFPIAHHLETL